MMQARFSLTKTPFPGIGDNLIYLVFSDSLELDSDIAKLNSLSKGRLFERMKEINFKGEKKELLSIDVDGGYRQLVVAGCGKRADFGYPLLINRIADAVRVLNKQKQKTAHIFVSKEWGIQFPKIGEAIAVATHLANYHFSKYKSHEKTEGPSEIAEITLLVEPSLATAGNMDKLKTGIKKGTLLAEGICYTRDLVNEPASHVYPITLAQEAKKIAKESKGKITAKVLSASDCEKLGMGAYLGVAQGSDNVPQFIVLHYKPAIDAKKKKRIALVGKSVTFDTGGYQVKPDMFMSDMKIDMGGGATMLGVFKILSQWDEKAFGTLKYDVYAVLPACENMISGHAFRPGDVLTAMNGKTIEVRHTDAEGRLTLADAISYADTEINADIVIDFATLTGAVMVALGSDVAGAFSNDAGLAYTFMTAAKEEGEEVWQLPLVEKYKAHIKGDVADLSNLGTKDRLGGAITAALFVQEFVGNMKWLHVDIAGTAYTDDAAAGINTKGATGWGVRTLIQVLT